MTVTGTFLASEIVITTANRVIIFRENGGVTDRTATLATGTYYLYGNGSEATDILKAITDALTAGSGVAATYSVGTSVAYMQDGSYPFDWAITTSSTSWSLRGADVLTTFPLNLIGLTEANTPFSASVGIDSVAASIWAGDQPCATRDLVAVEKQVAQHRTPNGQRYTAVLASGTDRLLLRWEHLSTQSTWGDGSAYDARGARYFWDLVSDGRSIRVYRDTVSGGAFATLAAADLVGTFVLAEDSCNRFEAQRSDGRAPLYSWEIELEEYVA